MLFFAFAVMAEVGYGDTFVFDGITYFVTNANAMQVKVDATKDAHGVVVIPAVVRYQGELYDVVEIGGAAFDRCKKLKKIQLPSTIRSVGVTAFSGTGIKDIDLPSGITSFGMSAFANSSLEAIVIPSEVRTIPEAAFMNCKSLKSVVLNSNVEKIERWAFLYTSLKQVKLPASVTEIAVNAFPDCLREVQCDAVTPPVIKKMAFSEETYEKGVLIVPFHSVDKYRSHEFWGQFKNIKPQ